MIRTMQITTMDCDTAVIHVGGIAVAVRVTRLNSVPRPGISHSAYPVEAEGNVIMIDCVRGITPIWTAAR